LLYSSAVVVVVAAVLVVPVVSGTAPVVVVAVLVSVEAGVNVLAGILVVLLLIAHVVVAVLVAVVDDVTLFLGVVAVVVYDVALVVVVAGVLVALLVFVAVLVVPINVGHFVNLLNSSYTIRLLQLRTYTLAELYSWFPVKRQRKLGYSPMESLSSKPSLIFASEAGAFPSGTTFGYSSIE
jgi:hypothetical protein